MLSPANVNVSKQWKVRTCNFLIKPHRTAQQENNVPNAICWQEQQKSPSYRFQSRNCSFPYKLSGEEEDEENWMRSLRERPPIPSVME